MKYQTITIVSEIENDLQSWTFYIEEGDLLALVDKYGAEGFSVRGTTTDTIESIIDVWR